MNVTLVIGGCRSGKSDRAQMLAEAVEGRRIYVATCIPQDPEMHERIALHRRKRGAGWETVETSLDLDVVLREERPLADVILVDCLTLWVTNLLMEDDTGGLIPEFLGRVLDALEEPGCPVIFVTNEVGTGIVPDNRLARRFRDAAGQVNQAVAAVADRVVWMVAGIPVTVKGKGSSITS
jgi:adenosylcobinamide kinase / adenosylcobinamide-phosphate guanylyltransferase